MMRKLIAAGAVAALLVTGFVSVAPQAAQAQTACGASVVVQPGDTLFRIASRCGVSVQQILNANPALTNPNNIRLGQTLRLVGAPQPAPQPNPGGWRPTPPPPPSQGQVISHVVRPGETLASIARQYGITMGTLIDANPQISDPSLIRIGTTLRIPGRGQVPQPGQPVQPQPPRPGTIVGVVTNEGATCPAIRDDRGQLYTLAGEYGNLRVGDRIEVTGRTAQMSYCQQGTTIDVTSVRSVPRPQPQPQPQVMTFSAIVTNEGVTCTAVRDDNNRLYTLAGNYPNLRPGDRVEVSGRPAQVSTCQQGTTIDVSSIRQVGRPSQPAPWPVPLPQPQPQNWTFSGVITDEGLACPAVRDDRGRLYTLIGNIPGFAIGQRIEFTGRAVEVSTCQQGTTIRVEDWRPAGRPSGGWGR